MTDTKKKMTGMLGTLLAAAILTMGGIRNSNSKPVATDTNPIDSPVLTADGGMPAPPPVPLPKGGGGTKRA
jgi:hypothetical protein